MDDMVPFVVVNWVSIIVAAIGAFIVGMLWYSPALFGKQWMKMMGMSEKDMKAGKDKMTGMMVVTLVLGVISAWVLSHVFNYAGVVTMMDGVFVAAMMWLGFYATSTYMGVMYEKKSMEWWYLTAGHYLVSLIVMGLVLVQMGY